MKVVNKPWGKEVWMELNEFYCFKQLHINAGARLSLQAHNIKTETMCVFSGRVRIIIGTEFKELGPGEFVHISPKTIHRVEAICDAIIIEASTPEVDDIIRLEDDYKRIEENV